MSLTSPVPCTYDDFIFYLRFLILDFLYLLSSAKSAVFLLRDILHFLSLDESDSLDGESDDDRSDSGSSGTCYFIFFLMIPLVMLVAWGLNFLYQQELSPNVKILHFSYLYH